MWGAPHRLLPSGDTLKEETMKQLERRLRELRAANFQRMFTVDLGYRSGETKPGQIGLVELILGPL